MSGNSDSLLLATGIPVGFLLAGSMVLFLRKGTASSFLQLLGAACLMVVVLTHVAENFHLFPWMEWGRPDSLGHYLDLWSAALGGTLFPVGYLLHAVRLRVPSS